MLASPQPVIFLNRIPSQHEIKNKKKRRTIPNDDEEIPIADPSPTSTMEPPTGHLTTATTEVPEEQKNVEETLVSPEEQSSRVEAELPNVIGS